MPRILHLSFVFRIWPMGLAAMLLAGCSAEYAAPEIRASRIFAGPGQYPPQDFAAYGILAFRSEPTAQSREQYLTICEGYLAGLPRATELEARGIPLAEQMGTVWPLDDIGLADELNSADLSYTDQIARCPDIVSNIDTIVSRDAILKATRSLGPSDFVREGPFLIAWSPSSDFGRLDAPVLVWDLSSVTTLPEATRMFTAWAVEIEMNPELWRDGWSVEGVRTAIRQWADRWGPDVLRALGI